MKKYHIPTAAYENFTSAEDALHYLETAKMPIVLKADGLALGKGVLICNTLEEAKAGVKEIMEDKKFGSAGNTMVVEEFMTGREVSVLSYVDGKTIKIMSSAQDHKRAKDGDQGLNTGGMGNFSPSPFYTKEVDEFCQKAHLSGDCGCDGGGGKTVYRRYFLRSDADGKRPQGTGIQCPLWRSGGPGGAAQTGKRHCGCI